MRCERPFHAHGLCSGFSDFLLARQVVLAPAGDLHAEGAPSQPNTCLATLADCVMRKQTCDVPSLLCLNYGGHAAGPGAPFGFEVGSFAVESEDLQLSAPELHGPTAEIARCAVDATLYALDASSFSNFARDTDGHMTGLRACSLQRRFAVSDWAAAAPIMEAIVEAAKRERGVIHFGWARSDDRLFLRAAHQNEAAILRHIDGVARRRIVQRKRRRRAASHQKIQRASSSAVRRKSLR